MFFMGGGKIGPALYIKHPDSQNLRMPVGGRRLLITLIMLVALGFCAVLLVVHPRTSHSGSDGTTSLTPARATAPSSVPNDRLSAVALRPNPAAQRAGPPDPIAERAAAAAAQNAAKAAAELAAE